MYLFSLHSDLWMSDECQRHTTDQNYSLEERLPIGLPIGSSNALNEHQFNIDLPLIICRYSTVDEVCHQRERRD